MHTTSPQNPDQAPSRANRPSPAAAAGWPSNPAGWLPHNGQGAGSGAADRLVGAPGGGDAGGSDLPTGATTDQKVWGSSPYGRASQVPDETPSDEGVSSFPGDGAGPSGERNQEPGAHTTASANTQTGR